MKTRAARAKESALSKNAENHRENAIGDDFEVDPNLQGTHTDSGKGQPESGCEAGKMNEQQEGSVNGEVEVDAGNDEKSAAKKWTRRRNQLVFGRVDSFYRCKEPGCGMYWDRKEINNKKNHVVHEHVKKCHPHLWEPFLVTPRDMNKKFSCPLADCGARFKKKTSVPRHMKKIHKRENFVEKSNVAAGKHRCSVPRCQFSASKEVLLLKHCASQHPECGYKQLMFFSADEFQAWKSEEEARTGGRFTKKFFSSAGCVHFPCQNSAKKLYYGRKLFPVKKCEAKIIKLRAKASGEFHVLSNTNHDHSEDFSGKIQEELTEEKNQPLDEEGETTDAPDERSAETSDQEKETHSNVPPPPEDSGPVQIAAAGQENGVSKRPEEPPQVCPRDEQMDLLTRRERIKEIAKIRQLLEGVCSAIVDPTTCVFSEYRSATDLIMRKVRPIAAGLKVPSDSWIRTRNVETQNGETRNRGQETREPRTEKQCKSIKNFECPDSERKFNSNSAFTYHSRTVHANEKPFACPQCSKTFRMKGVLKRHVLSVHLKSEKPYACPDCSKTFPSKIAVSAHVNSTHLKERPHKCPVCPKAYFCPYGLKRHISRAHRDERLSRPGLF